jgi:hypothetical protein
VQQLNGDRASVLVHGICEALEARNEAVIVKMQLHTLCAAIGVINDVMDAQGILHPA